MIKILVLDPPDRKTKGHCEYLIEDINDETNELVYLKFQKGDPANGLNGITNESLLAVVLDRLMSWQKGPFKCENNQRAIAALSDALYLLNKRSEERLDRGVEGKQVV